MKSPNVSDFYEDENRIPSTPENEAKLRMMRSLFSNQLKGSEQSIRLMDEYHRLLEILHPKVLAADGKKDYDAWFSSIKNDPEVSECDVEYADVEDVISSSTKSSDHQKALVTLRKLIDKLTAIIEKRKAK